MRIILVAQQHVLRFEIPVHVPPLMKFFQPKQTLICNSFDIDNVQLSFVNDIFKVLA